MIAKIGNAFPWQEQYFTTYEFEFINGGNTISTIEKLNDGSNYVISIL